MSSRPYDRPAGAGSVKRARERAMAGQPPVMPPAPSQRPYEGLGLPSNPAPSQAPRARPPLPTAMAGARAGQGPIGVAISRPTQVPQWPLAGAIEGTQDARDYLPPAGRGVAPARPPRPSHVPSMLDASKLQEHTPAFRYEVQQPARGPMMAFQGEESDDEYVMTSPISLTSRPSTMSSVGTIPDFPLPIVPPPPVLSAAGRRSANLGPPPSSRRGNSNYYSQASYVSPIPEESPRSKASHGSYASSAAIPSSWGSESPGFSPGYEYDEFDERDVMYGRRVDDVIEEGRESRESNVDDNDDRGLIRSASIGKRARPSMVVTKSSGTLPEMQRPAITPQQMSKLETMAWPMPSNLDSPLAGGTGLIDKSTSSSENEVPRVAKDAPPASYNASGATAMLGAYAAASSLQPPGTTPSRTPSPSGFSRLSAIRRPPRLDINAVRDAEARGSLTSLPDLIRRATRLAAMMDRGKRPGSRMALEDWPPEREKDFESSEEKRQSGLSGMLAAFPPPGLATPRENSPARRPASQWPSPPLNDEQSSTGFKSQQKKGRRCCGLPIWGFLFILLTVVLIAAAAVLVPLFLLVINKTPATPVLTPLQQCAQDPATACQNGGSTFLSSGACACICINGFTGGTCTNASATGCTVTTLSGLANVTLGDSIPRLIEAAQTNFSIPLSAATILSRFSSSNLSCLAENALVTFSGTSRRVGAANAVVVPSTTQAPLARRTDQAGVAPVNGIAFDPASPPVPKTTYSGTLTLAPAATTALPPTLQTAAPISNAASATQTPTSPSSFVVTQTSLDFARVAVLYVLQEQDITAATTAQGAMQRFINSDTNTVDTARTVNIGNGNAVDFVALTVTVANKTVGGGGSVGNATSNQRRRSTI